MSSEIRSVKTVVALAVAKRNEREDSHVVLAHMIGQQSNLIQGGTGMTCEMCRVMMQSSGRGSQAVALPIASQPNFLRCGSASSSAKGCQRPYKGEGESQEEAACKVAAGCES